MEDILKKMHEIINKYTIVLSQVLKVDIDIVDCKLNRIAGTGIYKDTVDRNIAEEGFIYKKVIETGIKQIINNPGKHEICQQCPKRDMCKELLEMSTPIILEGKVIGVIGFVCFTEIQRDHILDNLETFSEFIDQIADLISSKIHENIKYENNLVITELFNSIIDKIEEGVIVFGKDNSVSNINSIAKKTLSMDSDKINNLELVETGGKILNYTEYNLKFKEKSFSLAGRFYNINIGDYDKIFIFRDADLLKENAVALTGTNENIGLDKIIGTSIKIKELKEQVKMIATSSSTVLISGESGTGKELFARALHEENKKNHGFLVALNCGAIPDNLLESELFGYVKGAFTGADMKGKIGKFELANKGTLFLDEIGDMPLYIQVKLLRALEEKEIVRLGSNKTIKVDVRVIAATNKNLEKMIIEKTFREDLYYRLNVIPLHIPALRERKTDIPLLVTYFIEKFSRIFNKDVVMIEDGFWECVENYSWPGNIRELQNTIEYIINIMGKSGTIHTDLLPPRIKNSFDDVELEEFNLEKMERQLISRALNIYGNNGDSKIIIAQKLGIGIATLYRKLKMYNLA